MAAAAKISDAAFAYPEERLDKLSTEMPWLSEPRYFTRTMVAASAAMKMLQHAQTGVERGMARNPPVPIEIMGLMIGHVDPDDPRTLVVTDAFPLPVEGTETSVIADNPSVNEYMSGLMDAVEAVRRDRLIGWYHSHPFDVREHPNWFFSMVDVQTQNLWQSQFERSSKRHSDPFFGIVVDPLRSVAKGRPEMGAFRNFKPDYRPPDRLVGPDGKRYATEGAMTERWGPASLSYYSMEVVFFQTTLCRRVLDVLAREHLWARVLASAPMLDKEARESTAQRVAKLAATLARAEVSSASFGARRFGGPAAGRGETGAEEASDPLAEAARAAADVSVELLQGQAQQAVKYSTFSRLETDDGVDDDAKGAVASASASSSGKA